jgi:hypothetical protein
MIEQEREHKELLRIWNLYQNTDKALKRQVLASIDQVYIRSLKNRHTGFASVKTLTILNHLFNTYGKITPHDLELNNTRFRTKWDPNQPFEMLVEQIEDAIDFATSGLSPYTDKQIVDNAYTLVFGTGMFPEACREWRRTAAIDKTWPNFKTMFYTAHDDLREQQQHTAQGGGYHQANQAMENFCIETAESIAQMANAATADRAVLTEITNTNTTLLAQIKSKDKEIANLRRQLNNRTAPTDVSSADTVIAGNGTRRVLRDRPGKEQNTDPTKKRFNNNNYCHSHGYDCHEAHTSANCKFPKANHKTEATWENNMEGSQNNKAKVW